MEDDKYTISLRESYNNMSLDYVKTLDDHSIVSYVMISTVGRSHRKELRNYIRSSTYALIWSYRIGDRSFMIKKVTDNDIAMKWLELYPNDYNVMRKQICKVNGISELEFDYLYNKCSPI